MPKNIPTLLKKSIKYIVLVICFTGVMALIWAKVFDQIWEPEDESSLYGLLDIDLNSTNMKYILQWTSGSTEPFKFMGKGQETFINRQCSYNNCYVTSDRGHLPSITDFHVLLFHGPELYREVYPLPKKRSFQQKFVYVSMESSDYYPMCNDRYKGYFNWTWTYRLTSDLYYGYLIVRNDEGEVIGPQEDMHWLTVDEMKPIDDKMKARLDNKKLAAAWFVSNCNAPSGRLEFGKFLREELETKHNMTLDIYGACGPKKCLRNSMEECLRMISEKYYFYLSFENSFSEDYVTEKLLHALQNYAVPIVYGGANYTRFMPEGIYLDGRKLGVKALAQTMADLIKNKEEYYKFFKWHNHYSYHEPNDSPDTNYYCQLCKKLNSEEFMDTAVYDDLRKWWNPPKLRRHVCKN